MAMDVRLKKNIDFGDFLHQVNACEEDVILKTGRGDELNLQSEMSKYVLAVMLSDEERLENAQLYCKNERDRELFLKFSAD